MATNEQGIRGDGRGNNQDREDLMRDPETRRSGGFQRPIGDLREDLDRRTDREEIDRRHDWHRGGGMLGREHGREGGYWSEGRAYGGGSPGNYGEAGYGQPTYGSSGGYGSDAGYGRYGAGESGYGRYGTESGSGGSWERFGRDERGDMDRESRRYFPSGEGRSFESRYGRGGVSQTFGRERGFGMGPESRFGDESRFGGESDERGRRFFRGPETMGRHADEYGGYGGYGAGPYGGSYGGMGPGRESEYGAPGSWGGVSGAGSLAGTFGGASGWEPERMGMRPGAFALHSMMSGDVGMRARRARGWEREGPLVRDLMTKNIRTVSPDTPVCDVARMMRDEDAGIIPVVHDGRVLGVITDRDLATRVMAERKDINTTRANEVMSEDIHVCSPDDKLTEAVRMMGEENVRRLPVVDRDDRLKGMLSMTDVAREAEVDYALQEDRKSVV